MNNLILIGIGLGLRQNLYFATGENTNILGHKSTFCAVVKSIFFLFALLNSLVHFLLQLS